jgi:hypothetical protein
MERKIYWYTLSKYNYHADTAIKFDKISLNPFTFRTDKELLGRRDFHANQAYFYRDALDLLHEMGIK